MTYEVYKNDVISSDPVTNLAGETVYRPNAGSRRLGLDFISGVYEAEEDEVFSRTLVCDVCGFPVGAKADLTKVNGVQRCEDCIDG